MQPKIEKAAVHCRVQAMILFVMVYKATARIGIDVQKVKVWADDHEKIVYVEIPPVEIQDINVATDSIRYFDTKFSLFNLDQKDDANNAIALAKEEAKKEVQEMGVFQMAQDQASTLSKGILANVIPDGYTIEVKQ